MKVLIEDTIYDVIAKSENEVCVLQTFDYADGIKRQQRIWTEYYTEIEG